MLKLIILAIAFFFAHYKMSQQSGSSGSIFKFESRIDEFKRVGKNISKSTKSFKVIADDYINKFSCISGDPNLYTKTLADFNIEYKDHFKCYSHKIYSDLNSEENAMYEKLKRHIEKHKSAMKELGDNVLVAATEARARCFKPVIRRRA
ncbi:MAG: hypothetical protein MK132_14355 [Lentisphaerales bacterium]|nr:hypothetical protein [Lentisphaerales bacterium]